MIKRDRLPLAALETGGFGASFRREFELVIAQNEFASLTTGETLYNRDLDARVAHFCAPLDEGLSEYYRGRIPVPENAESPYLEVSDAVAFLADHPRGTWAHFVDKSGGWDAYMADGLGGSGTRTGNKFDVRSPDSPELSFEATYAALLGPAIYEARSRIRAEIVAASFAAAGDPVGRTVKDVYAAGKTWRRIETVGRSDRQSEAGVPGILAKATRPGVKTADLALAPSAFVHLFKPGFVMPERYRDAGGPDRTRTLGERREAAARAWLADEAGSIPGLAQSRYVSLRAEGDALVGRAYLETDAAGSPSAAFAVEFAAGTAEVAQARFDHRAPPLGMR